MAMIETLSILVIESDPDDIFFLTALFKKLQNQGVKSFIEFRASLKEAVNRLNERNFDVIITDLYLPDSEGLKTFLELQKKANSTPIIILGSGSEEKLARETIRLGAEDYIPKYDLTSDLLTRIIHYAIERHRLQKNLKTLSFEDELTRVYNRRGFIALLEQQIALAKRTKKGFFLFLIDCDYLKQINDTYGHLIGDHALMDLSKCLQSSFRKHDIIGRIGGDEFGVIAINTSTDNATYLKNHMLHQLEKNSSQTQEPYRLSFSIGMTYYDGIHDTSIEELFLLADRDLYEQKKQRPAFLKLNHRNQNSSDSI